MHCPGCGQQQISTETKFCSRCGLPLGVISEVLAYGGYLPQLAELNRKKTFFNKKNGVVLGLFWFVFFTMFMTAFFGILGAPEEFVGILAVTGVFGGLMTMIASLIFLPSSKKFVPNTFQPPVPSQMQGFGQQHNQSALPPQQTMPAASYAVPQAGNWRDTNDLQPNVSENATKLLEQDETVQIKNGRD